MSAPAFTPGPWQWVGEDEIEQAEHPFTSVAEVVRNHRNQPQDEVNANARLIAAAPALCDALECLLGRFDEMLRESGTDTTKTSEAIIANAALTQARGESA